jgi:ribosomal protein S18 acetylase RimI-like enzyme
MIEIDRLQEHHQPARLSLWRGYQAFYRARIPDDVTELNWRRLLDPTEPILGIGASMEGRLVGIAHAVLHRSFWTAGDYCYLQDLFIEPGMRGRGVGKALIGAVADAAAARGASRVIWLTHETNTAAIALYDQIADRTGFVQYRLRPSP